MVKIHLYLIGIHLTDIGIIKDLMSSDNNEELSEEELHYKKNASEWISNESGYMSIQSTKPQTLAYGVSDSPVGLRNFVDGVIIIITRLTIMPSGGPFTAMEEPELLA